MLTTEKLNQYYGGSHTLWDIDLDVPEGSCVCLMGRNGVGKTTLLKVIMGILPASSGKVKFDRERLVVVGFDTSGPPYGKLKYRIDQKKREVEFYCEEPKIGRNQFRGFAQSSRVGIFAVPAGTKVKWGGHK